MEEEERLTGIALQVQEAIDRIYAEHEGGLTPDSYGEVEAVIPADALEESVPALVRAEGQISSMIDRCDNCVKTWQESKKLWRERREQLLALAGHLLAGHGVKSCSRDGASIGTIVRKVLEVDCDALLRDYGPALAEMQKSLPDYIRLTASVDKTKLNACLKTDSSLLAERPDDIHWKESVSVNIKKRRPEE